MRNPYSTIETDTNLKKCFDRRLSIITELTRFNRERLLMWTFVQAVLAAWWHVEDNTNGIENMQHVANVSYEMIIKKNYCAIWIVLLNYLALIKSVLSSGYL